MSRPELLALAVLLALSTAVTPGCAGKRMRIVTGTTIGLSATPGNPDAGESPQVTLAYKRAELALVPTEGEGSRRDGSDPSRNRDAFSSLAAFHFATEFFGATEVASFLATGQAARSVLAENQGTPSAFTEKFAPAALERVSPSLQDRRLALNVRRKALSEKQAQDALRALERPEAQSGQAKEELKKAVLEATDEDKVRNVENAIGLAEAN